MSESPHFLMPPSSNTSASPSEPLPSPKLLSGESQDTPHLPQYTFHRHSAPKNIIYYRCSDKRCPARLHFNMDTKTYSLKNQHLNEKIHKVPSVQKFNTTSDLIANPQLMTRGPLVLDEQSLPSLESPVIDDHHKRLNPRGSGSETFMLQFRLSFCEDLAKFKQCLMDKGIASKVNCYSISNRIRNEISEKINLYLIEIMTVGQFIGKVLIIINSYFGTEIEITYYSLD